MANEWDWITLGVTEPFARPFAVNENAADTRMAE
jgi:hypothetical protein